MAEIFQKHAIVRVLIVQQQRVMNWNSTLALLHFFELCNSKPPPVAGMGMVHIWILLRRVIVMVKAGRLRGG